MLVDDHAHRVLLFCRLFLAYLLDLLLGNFGLFGDCLLDRKFELFRFLLRAQFPFDFGLLVYDFSALVSLSVVVLHTVVRSLWRHARRVLES